MALDRKRKRASDTRRTEDERHTSPEDDSEFEGEDSVMGEAYQPAHEEGDDSDASSEGHVEMLDPEGDADEEERAGEEEEWTGLDGEAAPAEGVAGPSKVRPKQVPKGEELRNIKDATDLYRSTAFKLQIDAMLPTVRPKYSKFAPLDRLLLSLHSHLQSLPSRPAQHPLAAARELSKKGVAVPYSLPQPTEETNWKVAFDKPSEIILVGSWALKTTVKPKDGGKWTVDLAVTMPETLFQEKDYLQGRFFHKRAYYLAVIAATLYDNKEYDVDLFWESAGGDSRHTTLLLIPNSDEFTKLNVQIRILPTLPKSSSIPLARLAPSRPSLRLSSDASASATDPATPLYNTALLFSTTHKPNLASVHAFQQAAPSFSDALALLRVWAYQRGYGPGAHTVRGFERRGALWVGLLECLILGEEGAGGKGKRRPLGKGLSSYQLFKAALDFLARTDFSKERVFAKAKEGHRYPPHEYESHEAVFVDTSSTVNLLAGVPLGSLDMLRHDARLTLETLETTGLNEDAFQPVFLKEQRELAARFDVILRVDVSSAKLRQVDPLTVLDHGSAYNALIATLVSTLRRGLGNRARAVAVMHPSSSPRPLSQAQPTNTGVIHLGLILDPEHAFRLVDHGPPAAESETAAAHAFRELWGDKAELRRFKDGSIVESVVWDVASADERAHIPALIARYLLQRHCGIAPECVWGWQAAWDALVRLPPAVSTLYASARAQTGTKAALAAFDAFVKALKALDEQLPLAVLNVSPAAPALRYTSVFAPVAIPPAALAAFPPSARYAAPLEVVLEFEKSGRWPDDLRAIQKIKLAFLERIASVLMGAQQGLRAAVVLGDGIITSEIQDQAYLEVRTADGWTLRARIWHDREERLLRDAIDDRPHVPKRLKRKTGVEAQTAREAQAALEVYRRRFLHAPRHHRAIASLAHRFGAYAGTVRVVKRWLASHWLLGAHVSEEVVELLCAYVFLRSAKAGTGLGEGRVGVPGTKERGFALVVELLKDWEWAGGLFVPLYSSDEDAVDAEKKEEKTSRVGGHRGVWTLSTEADPEGRMWTANGPDAIVARRVRAVAKATWECLQGVDDGPLDVKTLFAHPTDHYDFLVELEPSVLPRYAQNICADEKLLAKQVKHAALHAVDESTKTAKPGFDPAQLLFDDLKRVYKDTCMLFHDPLGGTRIGAVWVPTLRTPRPFRALGGFSSTPARKEDGKEKAKEKEKALVVLNETAVLGEIERMGAGLIKSIIVQE